MIFFSKLKRCSLILVESSKFIPHVKIWTYESDFLTSPSLFDLPFCSWQLTLHKVENIIIIRGFGFSIIRMFVILWEFPKAYSFIFVLIFNFRFPHLLK
jgi:hypothetical protein